MPEMDASFAQTRAWLQHLFDPGAAVSIRVFAIHGTFDEESFAIALGKVVARHLLLGRHVTGREKPEIVVAGTVDPALRVRAAGADPLAELSASARRPFDLAHEAPFRVETMRVAQKRSLLAFALHPISGDAESLSILIEELSAALRGELPDGPVTQYEDIWPAADLAEEQARTSRLAFWKAALSGAPELTDLACDRPRAMMQRASYRAAETALDPALAAGVSALAGGDLLLGLTAALAALIQRRSRQTEVVIGLRIPGRDARTTRVVGPFEQILPLRLCVAPDSSFRSLLARAREQRTALLAQAIHFDRLVDELVPHRSPSHPPVVQVLVGLSPAPRLELPAAQVETLPFGGDAGQLDLAFSVQDGSAPRLRLLANDRLFDEGTPERMLGHLVRLMEAAVREPDAPMRRHDLLGKAERAAILSRWKDGARSFPVRDCVHQRFAAQARATPDAVALTCGAERLTYAELDARTNQLARHLVSLGVGREVKVGLCVERGLDLVVGLIGILKAGGAYLPIDLAYPPERLAFMLEDARAPILVTQSRLADRIPAKGASAVLLDADWPAIAGHDAGAFESGATPDDLCYVLYTSGSTGRPKGCEVLHRNVARLFDATQSWFGFDQRDVWTLFHSHAFDFSVWELWGALLHGGRVVVVPFEVSRSPADFLALLSREHVTVLNQTPSAFRHLMSADRESTPPLPLSLRWVIFGGEALELQSLRPWFERRGDDQPRLVNMYGITETTVHVTWRPLRLADLEGAPGSVIGRPIPDLQVYALDENLELVPVGVPGELFVGGAGLARGYLNRPDLTAERFIPDPFADTPGARLYRTGDLGRLLAGEDLEYLGRVDLQVKIRGFRIELGEIEAELARHPAVHAALAVVREPEPGDKRIVAYVAARDPAGTLAADLRKQLSTRLPDYMVPSGYVVLERLPLTPNGKVDSQALPPWLPTRQAEVAYAVPQGELERSIAAIFRDVIGVDRVGLHDNFFDLGGHSLHVVQVNARLQELTRREVPFVAVFQCPTVSALASFLGAAANRTEVDAVVADRAGRQRAVLEKQRAARGRKP